MPIVTRIFSVFCLLSMLVLAQNEKREAIEKIRQNLAANRAYIHYSVRGNYKKEVVNNYLKLFEEDGRFSDLHLESFTPEKYGGGPQKKLATKLFEAWKRIRLLGQLTLEEGEYRNNPAFKAQLMKSAIYYGDYELRRCDGWFRFHVSCFGIPRIAYGVYFLFFEDFDNAEKNGDSDTLSGKCSLVLRNLMRQTFTQPKRNDVPDPYTIEQFRNHAWWVGGNFAYRPTFEAAAVCSDVRMFDIIAEVCTKALSPVSHNTRKNAFWTEGICADSAGWGHGEQCYVWGYPSDGVSSLLDLLKRFRGTPWEQAVSPEALQRSADYVDGMCWYQYRGRQTLMSPGRSGYSAGPGASAGKIATLATSLLAFDLPKAGKRNLETIVTQLKQKNIQTYGSRVFWNNDDIIRRHPDYYLGVNMVSVRSQSNEVVADGFSLYTDFFADGATFIHRDGLEYGNAKGAWDPSAIPGTTVRQTKLQKVRLWGGYRNLHNLAGGVADGNDGCAGFLYEKKKQEGSNNPGLYGVRAHKSYFVLNDSLVCLGAGIANLTPEVPGDIRTTIDQPERRAPIQLFLGKQPAKTFALNDKIGSQSISLGSNRNLLVQHRDIAYTILGEQTTGKVEIEASPKKTDWVARHGGNRRKKNLPATVSVLRLGINHQSPKEGKYGYIVQPLGRDVGQPLPAVVLENSKTIQAVASPDHRLIQAIFYSADTTLKAGNLTIGTDAPTALMLRREDGHLTLAIADLNQDPERQEAKITIATGKTTKTITIPLPSAPNSGKSARAEIKFP